MSDEDVRARWDADLLRFADHTVYQSSGWGRYKHARGWTPHHFLVEMDEAPAGMLQALVRVYPCRTVVTWCPGGPVGALEACNKESMARLSSVFDARAFYCRAVLLRARNKDDERYLESNGWRRPSRRLSATGTAIWNLRQTEERLLAGLNRNWRYSLRQAQKAHLRVEPLTPPPIQELSDLCRTMNVSKGVAATVRTADLAALFDSLGQQVLAYGCRNASGQLIAFHSCAIQGDRAWELVAATSEEGRQAGASFAVLWEMVGRCRQLNVGLYDLAGLDSEKAPGVANFKRWTGAQDVEWLGEWEWASCRLVRQAVDFAVRTRGDAALP